TEKFQIMIKRRQEANENVFAYVIAKLKLCELLGQLDFGEKKQHIIAGLRRDYRELGNIIMSRTCEDNKELVEIVKDYERMSEWRPKDKPIQCFKCGRQGHKSVECKSGKGSKSFSTQRPGQSVLFRTAVKCYNCSKLGHISKDCPEI